MRLDNMLLTASLFSKCSSFLMSGGFTQMLMGLLAFCQANGIEVYSYLPWVRLTPPLLELSLLIWPLQLANQPPRCTCTCCS